MYSFSLNFDLFAFTKVVNFHYFFRNKVSCIIIFCTFAVIKYNIMLDILITGGVGILTTIAGSFATWVFAKKKYNAEVDTNLI